MRLLILAATMLSTLSHADQAYQTKNAPGLWLQAGKQIIRIDEQFVTSRCKLAEDASSGDTFLLCSPMDQPKYVYQISNDRIGPETSTADYVVGRIFGHDRYFRVSETSPDDLHYRHGPAEMDFHRYWPPIGTRILRNVGL